jgi:Flp pilus assembly protein TadG
LHVDCEAMVRAPRWKALPRTGTRRGESGQALVEFALIAPVLFMVLIGIFKCAIAFNNYLVLTDAVRTGARQLAVSRGVPTACDSAIARVRSAAAELSDSKLTVAAQVAGSSSKCSDLGAGNEQGNDAEMSATYPCDLVILGIDFAPSCKLSSSVTERIE